MSATVITVFKAGDNGVVSCPPFAEVSQLHLYFCLQLKIPSTVYGSHLYLMCSYIIFSHFVQSRSPNGNHSSASGSMHTISHSISAGIASTPPCTESFTACCSDTSVSLTANELQLSRAAQVRSLTVIYPQPGSNRNKV